MPHRLSIFCLLIIGVLSVVPVQEVSAQPAFSGGKRELRGIWIASVMNYDWPLSPSLTPQQQRDSLTVLLDLFASSGFNAIFLQIRPECDALYPSTLEPWSYWLTGVQGTGPSPAYDPLAFAIAETHKRGMELHAWFNPYRAYRQDVTYPRHATHVVEQHPEWTIKCPDGFYLLNPGVRDVRDRITNVVCDVVRRYAIDGVHFDDYFYPYPEHSFTKQDSSAWAADPRGFSWDSVAYWRRDNVNLMIRQVHDSIHALKPSLKFGVSPFGIWKSGVPSGVTGMSSYSDIFCDPTAWLGGQYVDYIVPQLYWAMGGSQDYAALHNWWAGQRNGRHVYTGLADYKISLSGWPATEITTQIRFNQKGGLVQGSVQFRAYNLRTNDGGIVGALAGDVFRYPALVPVMEWKETIPPNAPGNLQMTFNSGSGLYTLTWTPSSVASDGDTAARYAIYRFTSPAPGPADIINPRNIIAVTGSATIAPPARVDSFNTQYYYAVAALDKNNNESTLSAVVTTAAPIAPPTLLSPASGSMTYPKGDPLTWRRQPGASAYRVQLDTTGTFTEGQLLLSVLTSDTFMVPANLKAGMTYHWRVIAGSQAGESPVSAPFTFTTGWLLPPTPLSPVGKTNVARLTTFQWLSNGATSYRLRVLDNTTKLSVLDTVTTDTTLTCQTALTATRLFQWYVRADNAYGESDWSAEARFRTGTELTGVLEDPGTPLRFALDQNFPNPFNPTTIIGFRIAGPGGGNASPGPVRTKLSIFDALGREVAVLVDEFRSEGMYEATFDAQGLASGVYLYRLQAGDFVETRTMLLIR